MNDKRIEFLRKVDVRAVWSKEDRDFTPWAASTDALSELFDACEIDAGTDFTVRTEVTLPGLKRKLDILVETEGGDRIAIENQFSVGDHDHLTRALAYAVGVDAKTVIVIAESHRPEFVHVADYLNSAAGAYKEHGIRIFLVSIELYSAPGSASYFPRFEVVSRPDEWEAATYELSHGDEGSTERDAKIFNFHESLLPKAREASGIFMNVAPSSGSWKAGSFGISGVQIRYDVSRESVVVQLWTHRKRPEENLAIFNALQEHRAEIDQMLDGWTVDWRAKNTGLVEIRIEGIGWGMTPSEAALSELASAIGQMSRIGKQYLSVIRAAVEVEGESVQ